MVTLTTLKTLYEICPLDEIFILKNFINVISLPPSPDRSTTYIDFILILT